MITSIIDKIEIIELNAKYFHAVDTANVDAYIDCWHQDGVSETGFGNATGHAELEKRFIITSQGFSKGKRHIPSNMIVTSDGQQAEMKSYLTVIERENNTQIIATATYHDHLEKVGGVWKFIKREQIIDPSFKK